MVQFDDDAIYFDEQQHRIRQLSIHPTLHDSSSILQVADESTTKPHGVKEWGHRRRPLEQSPAQASSP